MQLDFRTVPNSVGQQNLYILSQSLEASGQGSSIQLIVIATKGYLKPNSNQYSWWRGARFWVDYHTHYAF